MNQLSNLEDFLIERSGEVDLLSQHAPGNLESSNVCTNNT